MGFGSQMSRMGFAVAVPGPENNEAINQSQEIGAVAANTASEVYMKHVKEHGKPATLESAKALIAGFAVAEVDKLAETKGIEAFDKEAVKKYAKQSAEEALGQFGEF